MSEVVDEMRGRWVSRNYFDCFLMHSLNRNINWLLLIYNEEWGFEFWGFFQYRQWRRRWDRKRGDWITKDAAWTDSATKEPKWEQGQNDKNDEESNCKIDYIIYKIGTGWNVTYGDTQNYIATSQDKDYVWHWFWRIKNKKED